MVLLDSLSSYWGNKLRKVRLSLIINQSCADIKETLIHTEGDFSPFIAMSLPLVFPWTTCSSIISKNVNSAFYTLHTLTATTGNIHLAFYIIIVLHMTGCGLSVSMQMNAWSVPSYTSRFCANICVES